MKELLRECHLGIAESSLTADPEEQKSGSRLQFCVDSPLPFEEVSTSFEFAPLTGTPSGMYTHPAALRWPCLSPSLFKDCSEMLNHVTGYSQSYIEEGDSCRSMPACSDLPLEQADQLPQSSTILQTPTDDQIHVPCAQHATQHGSGNMVIGFGDFDEKHVLPGNEAMPMQGPMYGTAEAETSMSHYVWPAPVLVPVQIISQPISLANLLRQ